MIRVIRGRFREPMHQLHGKVLLIAYGNPGRLDDGLGPAVADAVQRIGLPSVTIESCYQLAVEHAEAAARHDVVIFADADASGPAPFRFDRSAIAWLARLVAEGCIHEASARCIA